MSNIVILLGLLESKLGAGDHGADAIDACSPFCVP
jgi:hypothetical protein